MLEGFDNMLKVIQRYFTCEGRFNMIYQYHISLLLHFTCLIKMLVMEELRKKNIDWEAFITYSHFQLNVALTP
jgi:hypothetical protein